MTKVKICGITGFPDALHAVLSGADAIGYNFVRGGKRYIDEGYAESISERLLQPVEKVGVFVNETIDEIGDVAAIADLTAIQLHGDESPKFAQELQEQTARFYRVIKSFNVGSDFDVRCVLDYDVDAVLLDGSSAHERGGSGKMFDWGIAVAVRELVDKVYLAGGLTPENVAEAVRTVQPYGVDVASGVESSPGEKDPAKVAAFIKAAKEAI